MPFGISYDDEFFPNDDRDGQVTLEVELNVGEPIWIGEHRLRVLDIDGDEIVVRVDSPGDDDEFLPEDTGWSDRPR